MTELTIWLPMPPDNANGRKHRMAEVREKRAYWEELRTRQAAKLLPPPPPAPLPCARVRPEIHYPNRRHQLDGDNAIRRLKPAIDWLVAHGYLAGDTHRHLRWDEPTHVVGAPTPLLSRVRLTLVPLAPPT